MIIILRDQGQVPQVLLQGAIEDLLPVVDFLSHVELSLFVEGHLQEDFGQWWHAVTDAFRRLIQKLSFSPCKDTYHHWPNWNNSLPVKSESSISIVDEMHRLKLCFTDKIMLEMFAWFRPWKNFTTSISISTSLWCETRHLACVSCIYMRIESNAWPVIHCPRIIPFVFFFSLLVCHHPG